MDLIGKLELFDSSSRKCNFLDFDEEKLLVILFIELNQISVAGCTLPSQKGKEMPKTPLLKCRFFFS